MIYNYMKKSYQNPEYLVIKTKIIITILIPFDVNATATANNNKVTTTLNILYIIIYITKNSQSQQHQIHIQGYLCSRWKPLKKPFEPFISVSYIFFYKCLQ